MVLTMGKKTTNMYLVYCSTALYIEGSSFYLILKMEVYIQLEGMETSWR